MPRLESAEQAENRPRAPLRFFPFDWQHPDDEMLIQLGRTRRPSDEVGGLCKVITGSFIFIISFAVAQVANGVQQHLNCSFSTGEFHYCFTGKAKQDERWHRSNHKSWPGLRKKKTDSYAK